MSDFEKLQALVKAAQAQEVLSPELRNVLDLKYFWNEERELPQAVFDLWGPRVETCEITFLSDRQWWELSVEPGHALVEQASGQDFEQALLLAIGDYWDEATRPTSGPGMLIPDED